MGSTVSLLFLDQNTIEPKDKGRDILNLSKIAALYVHLYNLKGYYCFCWHFRQIFIFQSLLISQVKYLFFLQPFFLVWVNVCFFKATKDICFSEFTSADFFQIQVSLLTFEHKMSKWMDLTNRVVIAYFPYYWSRDIPAYCSYLSCFA